MLESAHLRYQGSCMMLMSKDEDAVTFLGTAFLIHKDGYMLSAAHIIPERRELGVVPTKHDSKYTALTMEHVYPIPVKVIKKDLKRGIALLKIVPEMEISVPDHIIGNPAETPLGTTLMTLGYSFGHYRLHSIIPLQSILSAKIETANGSHLLLFDNRVHSGDIGGPLINVNDERIVGIIIGGFNPADMIKEEYREDLSLSTTISQAVSIEYGEELLRSEGLTVL